MNRQEIILKGEKDNYEIWFPDDSTITITNGFGSICIDPDSLYKLIMNWNAEMGRDDS